MRDGAGHGWPEGDPVARARLATLIAAAVLAAYLAFVLIVHQLGLLVFPQIGAVSGMLLGATVLNLGLAAAARVWAPWRMAVYVYEGFHAIWFTVLLGLTGGGMELGITFVIYAFLVVHAWVMRHDASVYVTATLCGLCYAGLYLAEVSGGITTLPVLHRPPSPGEYGALVVFGFLALNFLALYASRYAAERRRLAEHLAALVVERTAELARTNAALEAKAHALETKQKELEEFVYLVTHDLKTPVNNVLLFADFLLESPSSALNDEARARVERIRSISGKAEHMITDLWKFVRTTAVAEEPTWIDLGALIARARESLEATIEAKDIRLVVGLLPTAWGRPNLEHVVANLLGNAVKYTPRGGAIEVSGRNDGSVTLFSVRDTGIGISADFHARIFELYGQVPGQTNGDGGANGTGVGLAIVRRIVESHGGRVWVESAPGDGSRFWVELPRPLDVPAEPVP
jgi:signal transduction histidine kinase